MGKKKDEPLNIPKIRQDDADLDAARRGKYQGDDPAILALQEYAEEVQEGTDDPSRD
jgi:hypothetical protein